MKFVQVVFPERLPRSNGFFDYKIPSTHLHDIKEGMLVEVPFRKSLKTGVIFSISNTSVVPLKKMRSISRTFPTLQLITQHQLNISRWLQSATGSSLGTIFHVLLPDKPKKNSYPNVSSSKKKLQHPKKNVTAQGYVFHAIDDVLQFVKRQASERKVTIIIVPDLLTSELLSKILPNSLKYDSSLNSTKKFASWEKIFNGLAHVVIGTRNALLLPYKKINAIILYDESNTTHQRIDQHPDVDTRFLAEFVASEYEAELFNVGTSLSVDTYANLMRSPSSIHIVKRKVYPKIKLIDSSFFIQKKQSPILPSDLLDYLVKKSTSAFIFYNRKGFYRRIHCSECGWEPRCQNCNSAFISEKNLKGELECRVCKKKSIIPLACPQCANPHIHFSYPGIEEIYSRLLQYIPASDVSLLTKEKNKTDSLHRIVIGTLYAVPYIDWRKINSTIVLDTDISLDFPDFRSSEWLLHRLQQIYSSMHNNSTIFLITKHPEHPALKAFSDHIPHEWYIRELKERKKMNFPPFSSFIKLSRIDKNKESGNQIVRQTISNLSTFFSEQSVQGSAVQLEPIPERSQSGFHFSILIRIFPKNDTIISALYDLCSSEWSITPNPLDLFS
jgi:primosomal protein N' (replication factor Y)